MPGYRPIRNIVPKQDNLFNYLLAIWEKGKPNKHSRNWHYMDHTKRPRPQFQLFYDGQNLIKVQLYDTIMAYVYQRGKESEVELGGIAYIEDKAYTRHFMWDVFGLYFARHKYDRSNPDNYYMMVHTVDGWARLYYGCVYRTTRRGEYKLTNPGPSQTIKDHVVDSKATAAYRKQERAKHITIALPILDSMAAPQQYRLSPAALADEIGEYIDYADSNEEDLNELLIDLARHPYEKRLKMFREATQIYKSVDRGYFIPTVRK